jgi:hypothetical protein
MIIGELIPKDVLRTCNVTLIVTTDEGAVATATSSLRIVKRITFPALLFKFIIENPWIIILIVIALILVMRMINYLRYKGKAAT